MKKNITKIVIVLCLIMTTSHFLSSQNIFRVPSQYSNIQAGVDAAWDGDTVLIADGLYSGDGNNSIYYFGKRITIKSENGPENCTVAGKFYFSGGEDTLSVLDGITIKGANNGGIGISGSSPLINNCVLQSAAYDDNSAVSISYGGGFFINCKFVDNHCSAKYSRGAAIMRNRLFSMDLPLFLMNCQFINNEAGVGAGAIDGDNIINYNCYFEENSSRYAAGSAIEGDILYIEKTIFYKNGTGGDRGAPGAISGSNMTIEDCMFDGNISTDDTPHYNSNILHVTNAEISNTIFINNVSDFPTVSSGNSIINCTFYNNKSFEEAVITGCNVNNSILFHNLPQEANNSTITYSLVRRGYPGEGNIDTIPFFANPDSLDFRLQPNSPCINAGDPTSPLDPDGTRADMGAVYFDQSEFHAYFLATPTSGYAPLTVNFTDLSTGAPTSWEWDFENDGTVDSYDQNPEFTYTEPGIYSVSLTISDGTDQSDTETKMDYITVISVEPVADFSADVTSGDDPLEVHFSDQSTQGLGIIDEWLWDFGDDNTSTLQNPVHIYEIPGSYTVSLTVTDLNTLSDTETKVDYITVSGGPLLNPPTNLSITEFAYATWDSPGGGASGTLSHNNGYIDGGIGTNAVASWICAARFDASDLATYYGSNLTKVKIHIRTADFSYIEARVYKGGSFGDPGTLVYAQDITSSVLIEDWTNHVLSTPVPLVAGNEYWIAYYIDATGDYPLSIDNGPVVPGKGDWMYNDGAWIEISTAFSLDYNWCIECVVGEAENIENEVISAKNIFSQPPGSMVISGIPEATFNHRKQKYESPDNTRALLGYNIYLDGEYVDFTTNLFWQYSGLTSGLTYTAGVTALYDDGESTIIEQPFTYSQFFADFTADVTSGNAPLEVSFTDLSTDAPTSWEWDFENDGTIDSYIQNPEWTYINPGTYSVSLTIGDGTNTDTEIKTNYITVSGGTALNPPTNLAVTELAYATWDAPPEIVFFDDYESYSIGEYLAVQSGEWTTWSNAPGSGEDAYVSDEQALSGTKSVKVEGSVTDLVHEYGNLTTGHYLVTHNFYIVSGYGGYYNLLHNFAGSSSEWGFEAFFSVNGTGSINAGGQNAATFAYTPATWTKCVVDIDLDNDWAIFFVNDVQIYEWKWSLDAYDGSPGMCRLGATDIFAGAPQGESAKYFFDDISLAEVQVRAELTGYKVYLDDEYVDFTSNLFWQYTGLASGVSYTAGVSALYNESESSIIEESFTYIQLTANFIADVTSGDAPLIVNFTDQSTQGTGVIDEWSWDFGDANNSTLQNPVHIYETPGTYTVAFTVTDVNDLSDTETKTDYITVIAVGPTAGFTSDVTSGDAPLMVQFTDVSTGDPSSWEWDFENDGTIDSYLQNPEFVYTMPGVYSVSLTVSDSRGSSTETKIDYITVFDPLVAEFVADVTSGNAPLEVSFTDLSTGEPTSWEWDFENDGTVDSYDQNPQHTYSLAGTYSVKLTIFDAKDSDVELKDDYISVYAGDNYFDPVWISPFNPMTFYILEANVDGNPLQVGAEVGLFDINPTSGEEICVGAGVLTEQFGGGVYLEMIASMNDGANPNQANGFTPGNAIIYKLWSMETGAVSTVTANYPYPGYDEVYASQGSAFVELYGENIITQTINLTQGWNLFSFRAIPENMDMLNIVQPLIDDDVLVKVLDEAGGSIFHLPFPPPNGQWSNSIGDLLVTDGYYIKVIDAASFDVQGSPVETPLEIPLYTGWNIISYPCEYPQNALESVQSLIDENVLVKVIDESGGTIFHLPFPPPNGQWSNTIGNLESGEGYYLKVTQNTSLTIACPTDFMENSNPEPVKAQTSFFHPVFENNPYMPMHIILSPNQELQAGDEIGVFDGDVCVGAAMYDGNNENPIIIITSMDDPDTEMLEGFKTGNTVNLMVWNNQSGQVTELLTTTLEGSETFEARETYAGIIQGIQTGCSDFQNQLFKFEFLPNPFNQNLKLSILLPSQGALTVEIFNLMGQKMNFSFQEDLQKGKHFISLDELQLKNGTYLVNISFTNENSLFQFTDKIIKN